MSSADTIFALATPPGKSGVAVLRLSGSQARQAVLALTRKEAFKAREAAYVAFYRPDGVVLDRGLALYFPGPKSFTGEDVVECHIHGGLAVIREFLGVLAEMPGLRYAEAGEFTRRAYGNGKMDLLEAEGLADLIDAETGEQKTQAARQMHGELSRYYEEVRGRMVRVLAHLEAYIDFPDEEIPASVLSGLADETTQLQASIRAAMDDKGRGERLRDGISVVIVGAPNVGKSSLLNALAKRDVAIVSQKAGTTRDMIEVHLDIKGYPVVLVDTAGIRESDEEIELEGIRRALRRADDADIRLVVFDACSWPLIETEFLPLLDAGSIVVVNKRDMVAADPVAVEGAGMPIAVSTRTGQGLEALLHALELRVMEQFSGGPAPFITRGRHRQLLGEALKYLDNSLKPLPLELRCEELRLAAGAVGKITGVIQVDDVLDVIFRSFCIGK